MMFSGGSGECRFDLWFLLLVLLVVINCDCHESRSPGLCKLNETVLLMTRTRTRSRAGAGV
mgnify:CR=1 FL=1